MDAHPFPEFLALVGFSRHARRLRTVSEIGRRVTTLHQYEQRGSFCGYTGPPHCPQPSSPCLAGRATMMSFLMNDFAPLLEEQIPRLRRYARALTHDVTRADDLVQSCLVRAIAKQHLWERGTNLRAWLFTILHNQHVNDVRHSVREGNTVELDEAPQLTVQGNAIVSLELRDLESAIGKLPPEQRQVILLVGLEGMAYEDVATVLDIPVGTVRSRLSRGRDQLRRLMGVEEKDASARAA